MTAPLTDETPRVAASAMTLTGITAGYGRTIVLRDVSISVPTGSVTALLGPNGAGKTTLLKVAAGLLRPSAGSVSIDGTDVTKRAAHKRAAAGLCLIPEGRGIFRSLTVRENLRVHLPPWRSSEPVDAALHAFPILADRLGQTAGSMSGGQQQMLAVARAYLAGPSVVLLDEVSMGLAPLIVDEIFTGLEALAATGASLLIVEQYVQRALAIADQVVILNHGSVSHAGPADGLDQQTLTRYYLGDAVAEPPTS